MVKELRFNGGDYIYQEGTVCTALYVVMGGQVEVFRWDKHRTKKIPLGIVASGEYLGEVSLLNAHTHYSNALALNDVVLLQISREAIEEQFEQVEPWLVALIHGLVNRLHGTNEVVRRNMVVDPRLEKTAATIEQNYQRAKKLG